MNTVTSASTFTSGTASNLRRNVSVSVHDRPLDHVPAYACLHSKRQKVKYCMIIMMWHIVPEQHQLGLLSCRRRPAALVGDLIVVRLC